MSGLLRVADISDNEYGRYTAMVKRFVDVFSDERAVLSQGFSGTYDRWGQQDFVHLKKITPRGGVYDFLHRLADDAYNNSCPTCEDARRALADLSGGNPDRWRTMINNANLFASLDKPADGKQAQTQLAALDTAATRNATADLTTRVALHDANPTGIDVQGVLNHLTAIRQVA